jgi:hypothetical protein
MSAIDTAKEIVRMGSTAGLSKDVIDLMEKKLALLTGELSDARTRISALEIENRQLRGQLEDSQPVEQPGDQCPFCRRATGQLLELKPDPVFHLHGWKVGYYKCSNQKCGKTYDKQLER